MRRFFILAIIFLIPFQSILKEILNINFIFIEPTLFLSVIFWIVYNRYITKKQYLIISFIFVINIVSGLFLNEWAEINIYDLVVQPLKLSMLIVFYNVILYELMEKKIELIDVSKILYYSLIFQFLFSVFMYLSWLNYLPSINPDFFIKNSFSDRFSLPVGGMILPRFFGTTQEPAPYGYFGLCCLLYAYYICKDKYKYKLIISSLFVILTSLSDQIFIALVPLFISYMFSQRKVNIITILFNYLIILCFFYVAYHVFDSISYKLSISANSASLGSSSGERMFHFNTAINILNEHIYGWICGLGAGLYGIYLNNIYQMWPKSTSTSFLIVEIVFSYGIMGLSIFLFFMKKYFKFYPLMITSLLMGNFFQVDWKTSSFFLILVLIHYEKFKNSN